MNSTRVSAVFIQAKEIARIADKDVVELAPVLKRKLVTRMHMETAAMSHFIFPLRDFLHKPTPRRVKTEYVKEVLGFFMPCPIQWLMFLLPMLMVLLMICMTAFILFSGRFHDEWKLWRGDAGQATGIVSYIEQMSGSKGGNVFIYHYRFRPVENSLWDKEFSGKGNAIVLELFESGLPFSQRYGRLHWFAQPEATRTPKSVA